MMLQDCVSKIPSENELFLLGSQEYLESAKIGRDRVTQAVTQISPTINSVGEIEDVLDNDGCQDLIYPLGVGI